MSRFKLDKQAGTTGTGMSFLFKSVEPLVKECNTWDDVKAALLEFYEDHHITDSTAKKMDEANGKRVYYFTARIDQRPTLFSEVSLMPFDSSHEYASKGKLQMQFHPALSRSDAWWSPCVVIIYLDTE